MLKKLNEGVYADKRRLLVLTTISLKVSVREREREKRIN
jgi:hypothetical protein